MLAMTQRELSAHYEATLNPIDLPAEDLERFFAPLRYEHSLTPPHAAEQPAPTPQPCVEPIADSQDVASEDQPETEQPRARPADAESDLYHSDWADDPAASQQSRFRRRLLDKIKVFFRWQPAGVCDMLRVVGKDQPPSEPDTLIGDRSHLGLASPSESPRPGVGGFSFMGPRTVEDEAVAELSWWASNNK
jgi:hypothetical protein